MEVGQGVGVTWGGAEDRRGGGRRGWGRRGTAGDGGAMVTGQEAVVGGGR